MYAYAFLSVAIVSCLSLLGALFLIMKRSVITSVMTYLLAFSSGVLLGGAFFDLLPESLEKIPSETLVLALVGIVVFFSVEKLLSWHHHFEDDEFGRAKRLAYLSLVGDSIHNFVDGVVIGASFLVSIPLGISVTAAVIAHEIPHELADFTILLHGGFSNSRALLYNFLSALTALLGTSIVIIASTFANSLATYILPFAAGNFLYIAMSDLIPELHRHRSRTVSIRQLLALIVGVLLIRFLPTG